MFALISFSYFPFAVVGAQNIFHIFSFIHILYVTHSTITWLPVSSWTTVIQTQCQIIFKIRNRLLCIYNSYKFSHRRKFVRWNFFFFLLLKLFSYKFVYLHWLKSNTQSFSSHDFYSIFFLHLIFLFFYLNKWANSLHF